MMSDITITDTSGVMLGGRYLLREPVGEGGMAVVWRAYDTHLKRDVALKLLHEHVLPVDRERFGREIRTLAQISHPGIIGIYDLGEDAGRVFFTMELLTGGLISSIGPLEDSSEDFERFLSVACEAADALAHIHAKGIVHRDLTPRNILLDKDFHPRVMDFGLVYVSDATRDLTRTGYTLGTPQYMAPEQARGGVVEAASDLYAFGAVLYRAATGRAVFEADNDQGVLYQHVYEKPKNLEDVNPAVPNSISKAVLQFLEKQSGDRPVMARVTLEAAAEQVWREHVPAQFRGGVARTGVHPGGPARANQLKPTWNMSLPGEIAWPMAVTANRDHFAVGTRSGVLSVLELASGARYADFPSADEVTAPATFDGDCIVYAGWDGLVRCVEWRTGVTRWTHRTRAEITAAPTKWGQTWLIASRDQHLHAVNNGKLEWTYRTGAAMAGSPLIWGGVCFVCDEDGWLHAVNASTGTLEWKVELGSVHGTPAISRHPSQPEDAILVVPTWQGEVHALHLSRLDGRLRPQDEPLWTYDLEGEIWASPAIWNGQVFLGSWANKVHALKLESGDDLWELELEGRLTASPIVSRGMLYLASEAGEVRGVQASTGRVLFEDQLEGGVQCTPIITDGTLIVPSLNGKIRCYR